MASWKDLVASGVPKNASDKAYPRKEVRSLTEEENYLFMEGLARFQQIGINDKHPKPDSYYEIAGIHGVPYRKWPNESFNTEMPDSNLTPAQSQLGFCTHTSILFLTWHRPYLALFESILHKHVSLIAAGISEKDGKDRYVAAAKKFRLPYWDWAQFGLDVFPRTAISNTVWWSGPQSTNSLWPNGKYNPLHHAPLPSGKDDAGKDIADPDLLAIGNPTLRQKNVSKEKREQNLWAKVEEFYNSKNLNGREIHAARNLTERVANILGAYKRYGPVSQNRYTFDANNGNSRSVDSEVWGGLEDIHNTIHNVVGQGGQMNAPQYSAFDPIFWLHHCNIDRLLALWQGLQEDQSKDDAWVTSQKVSPTFMKANDKKNDDNTTPLYPFKYLDRSGQLKWYTSAETHNTEDFNYSYPETVGLSGVAPQERVKSLTLSVATLYPQLADDVSASKANVPDAGVRFLPQAKVVQKLAAESVFASAEEGLKVMSAVPEQQVLLQESLEPEKPFLRDLAPSGKYLDWIVNIKGEKHAFDGRYAVYVFLGPVDEPNVQLWPLAPTFVGLFYPFGQPADTSCPKCQQDQASKVEVTGQIPLTVALVERYLAQIIPDLTPETVVPYLQKNLHWRVAVNHEALNDRAQVEGLTVFVVSNEVTPTERADQLPMFANEVTIHAAATTNRDGTGRGNGTGLALGEDGTTQ